MKIICPLNTDIVLMNELTTADYQEIQDFLTKSYWAEGRDITKVEQSFRNSHAYILKTTSGELVGAMRLITDTCVFAYVADVFLNESYRGQKLAEWMMTTVMALPDYKGMERWMLATKDASGFYEKLGFGPMSFSQWMMDFRP